MHAHPATNAHTPTSSPNTPDIYTHTLAHNTTHILSVCGRWWEPTVPALGTIEAGGGAKYWTPRSSTLTPRHTAPRLPLAHTPHSTSCTHGWYGEQTGVRVGKARCRAVRYAFMLTTPKHRRPQQTRAVHTRHPDTVIYYTPHTHGRCRGANGCARWKSLVPGSRVRMHACSPSHQRPPTHQRPHQSRPPHTRYPDTIPHYTTHRTSSLCVEVVGARGGQARCRAAGPHACSPSHQRPHTNVLAKAVHHTPDIHIHSYTILRTYCPSVCGRRWEPAVPALRTGVGGCAKYWTPRSSTLTPRHTVPHSHVTHSLTHHTTHRVQMAGVGSQRVREVGKAGVGRAAGCPFTLTQPPTHRRHHEKPSPDIHTQSYTTHHTHCLCVGGGGCQPYLHRVLPG
jgi:hypothetical protein